MNVNINSKVTGKNVAHRLAHPFAFDGGKATCQETEEGGFFVMLPSGDVFFRKTQPEADKLCRDHFRKHCPAGKISLGTIVWHMLPKQKTIIKEVLQPTLTA